MSILEKHIRDGGPRSNKEITTQVVEILKARASESYSDMERDKIKPGATPLSKRWCDAVRKAANSERAQGALAYPFAHMLLTT